MTETELAMREAAFFVERVREACESKALADSLAHGDPEAFGRAMQKFYSAMNCARGLADTTLKLAWLPYAGATEHGHTIPSVRHATITTDLVRPFKE